MNNLFILGAYVAPPLVRESRLIRDLTMPQRSWDVYEEPAYRRNPGYVAHARRRHKWPVVRVSALIRRQAS